MLQRRACAAMGTRFELVLPAGPAAAAAGAEALAIIQEEDRRLSAFRPEGLPARLARAAGTAIRVDDEILDLLDLCREVHLASDGAFDPTLGALMAAWGFRGGGGTAGGTDPRRIPAGMAGLEWDRSRRRVRLAPGLGLDLGAVGKGWALDRAGEFLREAGVPWALLHGGTSTVLALGNPPGEPAGWRVAIRRPEGGLLETVTLRDRALSVSARHGRPGEHPGTAHVLDPRTREPVRGQALAAVVAADAARADAWSTALLVLGRVPGSAPLSLARLVPAAPDAPATSLPTQESP